MRFTGQDAEIDIAPRGGRKAEFDAWRWADAAELPQLDRALQAAGLLRRRAGVCGLCRVGAGSLGLPQALR